MQERMRTGKQEPSCALIVCLAAVPVLHYSLHGRMADKRICSKTFISTVICLQNGHPTKNFAPLLYE